MLRDGTRTRYFVLTDPPHTVEPVQARPQQEVDSLGPRLRSPPSKAVLCLARQPRSPSSNSSPNSSSKPEAFSVRQRLNNPPHNRSKAAAYSGRRRRQPNPSRQEACLGQQLHSNHSRRREDCLEAQQHSSQHREGVFSAERHRHSRRKWAACSEVGSSSSSSNHSNSSNNRRADSSVAQLRIPAACLGPNRRRPTRGAGSCK